jgi:hypothetical protein
MPTADRLTVLFVGGLGRSGSTLINRMLGQLPGFVSVGEVREVWERGFLRNHLCGCGQPFRQCPFWTAVTANAFGDLSPAGAERVLRLKDVWDRHRFAPLFVLPRLRPPAHRAAIREYAACLGALLRAIAEVARARVIVDSSKTPAHLVALAELGNVDVHVLHLIRDPRAVAHSWRRTLRRPDAHAAEEYFPRLHPARTALLWAGINVLLWWQRLSVRSYRRLRYEDLVRDPAPLAEVVGALGEPVSSLPDGWKGDVHLDVHHNIAGNPVKFQTGTIPLRLDAQWEREMPVGARLLVGAITWPLLVAYGYGR